MRSSSERCFRSLGFTASVCSRPPSILHLQVPHSPPPHLNGMPPFSRRDTRSKLLFSGAVTTFPLLVRNVISIMAASALRTWLGGSQFSQRGVHRAERGQVLQLAECKLGSFKFFQEF